MTTIGDIRASCDGDLTGVVIMVTAFDGSPQPYLVVRNMGACVFAVRWTEDPAAQRVEIPFINDKKARAAVPEDDLGEMSDELRLYLTQRHLEVLRMITEDRATD